MRRKQTEQILKDLHNKMVIITGPRQVGKTWLAKDVAGHYENAVYLNHDSMEDRILIRKKTWLDKTELLVLDELHKMSGWKNYLKGLYDTKPDHLKILVTGSASLDTFRREGDSLAGRYFRHRLNPLSIAEIPDADELCLDRLIKRGGFPEPYLAEEDSHADRWRMQYVDGLIRTDILDFEKIRDLKAIETTLELLRRRVGSPVSVSSLSEDLACSPHTIKRYIDILEALYIIFRVTPYINNIARSILKEPKIYFYDTGLVIGDEGARFENMMAISLLKHCHFIEDYKGKRASVHYLRTKEKKEVDFALAVEGEEILLLEVKVSDKKISPALIYFHNKYQLPAIQVVKNLKQGFKDSTIEVHPAFDFLRGLSL